MGNNDEIATTARSKFMLRTLVFSVQVIVFHNLLEPSIYSGFNIPYLEHSRNSCKHFWWGWAHGSWGKVLATHTQRQEFKFPSSRQLPLQSQNSGGRDQGFPRTRQIARVAESVGSEIKWETLLQNIKVEKSQGWHMSGRSCRGSALIGPSYCAKDPWEPVLFDVIWTCPSLHFQQALEVMVKSICRSDVRWRYSCLPEFTL